MWWKRKSRRERLEKKIQLLEAIARKAVGENKLVKQQLASLVEENKDTIKITTWLSSKLYEIAYKDDGLAEVEGPLSNPKILAILREVIPQAKDDSKASWCGAIMGYWVRQLGLEPPEKYAVARKWLEFGEPVDNPVVGDIVVLWRESASSWKGHVGLYAGKTKEGKLIVLGGNQRNQVNRSAYPQERLLGYRRPVK